MLPDGGDGGVDGARADGSSPDADSVDAGVRDGGLPGSCDTSESPAAPCSPNTPTTLVPLNLGASYLARVSAAVTLARGQPQLVVGVVEDAGPTREAALISTAFDDQFATVGRFSLTGAIELASGVRPSAASSFAVARSAPGTVAYTLLGDDPPGAPTGIWVGRVEYAAVDPAATATNLAGGDPADVLGEAAAVGGRDGLFAGARHFWREATLSDPPALAALPASDVGMAAFRATNQGVPAESEAVRVASTEGGLVFMRAPTAGDLLAWSGWGTGPGAAGEPNTLNAATAPEVLTVAGGGVRLVGFDAAWLAGEDYAIATIEDGGGAPEVRVRIASCSQRCGAGGHGMHTHVLRGSVHRGGQSVRGGRSEGGRRPRRRGSLGGLGGRG